MTEERFNEWMIDVHGSLFHVEPTDLDDDLGVRIDELVVLRAIMSEPEVLKHKSLIWLCNYFLNVGS